MTPSILEAFINHKIAIREDYSESYLALTELLNANGFEWNSGEDIREVMSNTDCSDNYIAYSNYTTVRGVWHNRPDIILKYYPKIQLVNAEDLFINHKNPDFSDIDNILEVNKW